MLHIYLWHLAEILVHPESRLAATGAEVLFICKIDYAVEAHWVINRTHHMLEPHQRKQFAAQGFVVEEQMAGTITILTLRVNATTDKNDTEVYCLSSHATRSNTALLLVISGKMMLMNDIAMYLHFNNYTCDKKLWNALPTPMKSFVNE